MSEKKPQAGEWWFSPDNKRRMLCHGVTSGGNVIMEHRDGQIDAYTKFLNRWHHEPRCTGWEWQPEPDPEWFDLTAMDEHKLRANTDRGSTASVTGAETWLDGVQWPEYMTVAIAKRCGWIQFRCLLKDAPMPVAEDPDEWVTQDRVPARPGVDERRWKNRYDVPDDWGSCAGLSEDAYHGLTTGSGHRLELRCRRRDLPLIPEPKPATQTIVFYEVIRRIAVCNEKKEEVITWTSYPMDSDFRTEETREVVR